MTHRPSNGQLAVVGIELLLFTILSYYGIKWLAKVLDPTSKQKEAAKKQLSEYEISIAALLVDPLNLPISWNDIGGLDNIINEMKESVILPFQRRDLFNSSILLSAPKGVLLYGPPGCGKTMIAKATAKQAGCRFINLEVSSLTDKWYGESQKLAGAVFSLATKIQPCIIFIDEIDSFLRSRDTHDNEATAMMKAQFMSLWDGLLSQQCIDVIIMAATNRPQDIDRAILRRLPCRFHIGLPKVEQRIEILQIILQDENIADDVNLIEVGNHTEGYSGSDLKELCRLAALQCLRRQVNYDDVRSSRDVLQPIKMGDFLNAFNRMKANNILLPKDLL